MTLPVPRPDDPKESLYAQARLLHETCEAQRAVLDGIKAYMAPWRTDKRMHIMHDMMMREIARLEQAAERTRSPS